MAVPYFLGQDVDVADAVEHRALHDIVGRQEAIDVVGAQVGDHLGRRHDAQLHVLVRVDAMFGEIVAQQVIVVRIVERDGEFHSLPRRRIAPILVFQGEANGLAVDVLDGWNRERDRGRSQAHRNRDRHRRQHMGGVEFLVHGLVAYDGPARGLDDVDVEALLGVEAEGRRHDDGRGAGDRYEADRELFLFERRGLSKGFDRGHDRKELGERCRGARTADRSQKGAPCLDPWNDGTEKGLLDAGLKNPLAGGERARWPALTSQSTIRPTIRQVRRAA